VKSFYNVTYTPAVMSAFEQLVQSPPSGGDPIERDINSTSLLFSPRMRGCFYLIWTFLSETLNSPKKKINDIIHPWDTILLHEIKNIERDIMQNAAEKGENLD
jgi:hypothetical protein